MKALLLATGSLLGVALAASAAFIDSGLLPPMNGNPADFGVRRSGAEAGAEIRIVVTNEGFHRVTTADLLAAGVAPSAVAGAGMRLFNREREVAISVSRPGLWGAQDYLVFYGVPRKGIYSDANVYWLALGSAGGERIGSRSGAVLVGAEEVADAPWKAVYDKKTFLHEKMRPMDESHDHWFCAILSETGRVTYSVQTPYAVPDKPAALKAVLFGKSSSRSVAPDHFTRMRINGQLVLSADFDGEEILAPVAETTGALLREVNTVEFSQEPPAGGVRTDRVFLDRFELVYNRRLVLAEGGLAFEGRGQPANYRVQGLPAGEEVWLADVTDPARPVRLEGLEAGGEALRFGDAATESRRYALWPEGRFLAPAKVAKVAWKGLGDTARQADYVIVAPAAFVPVLGRLAARRILQGLKTEIVALPDIYNEFSYGIEDASAIKQFIGYAFHHWEAPSPRYVLLAGNGSFDPKGFLLGQRGLKDWRSRERVPVVMGASEHGWASLDGWYAAVNGGDRLPDVALGRLPAQSIGMLSNMVSKIIAFEQVGSKNLVRKQALLAADKKEAGLDGRQVCEWWRESILEPNSFTATTAYMDDISREACRSTILQAIQSGSYLVKLIGHGGADQWGGYLLTSQDALLLRNAYTPLFLMMACRSGAFQNPVDGLSLMEALMQNKSGGASACIGATAMSYGDSSVEFSNGFAEGLFLRKTSRIGDAFLKGLHSLHAYNPYTEELLYFNLFADPAMKVR